MKKAIDSYREYKSELSITLSSQNTSKFLDDKDEQNSPKQSVILCNNDEQDNRLSFTPLNKSRAYLNE